MEKIEFDLDLYKTGKYDVVTREDEPVEIKFTNGRERDYPIRGYIDTEKDLESWNRNGRFVDGGGEQDEDLFLVEKEQPVEQTKQSKNGEMILWQGDNLLDVLNFTGVHPNFWNWFKDIDSYKKYVQEHGNIFKIFNSDGSHYEVPVGAWIVKTPDGKNVPSIGKLIQPTKQTEEISEDLEKAADTYVGFPYELGEDITSTIRRNSFKAGAQWQKEQMEERWLKDREGCFWDGVEEGKKVMKKQMLKDAVDARVVYIAHWHKNIVTDSADVEKALQNFEEGDKVKIIIVKED